MKNFIFTQLKKHEHGLVHTSFLTDAADRMISDGVNQHDLSIIKSSVSFLKNEIERNTENEEEYLYPVISNSMDPGNLIKLKKEHRLLRMNLDKMDDILNSITGNGHSLDYVVLLKKTATELSKLLKEHFMDEKDYLLTMAIKTLNEKDIKTLFKERI